MKFRDGGIYHVFNRGVVKLPIVRSKYDCARFVQGLEYYRVSGRKKLSEYLNEKKSNREETVSEEGNELVEILAYVLMPNHYHLMIRQLVEEGISTYVRIVANSYAHYMNKRYDRGGALFQGNFKAVEVNSDEQLIHLSRYIHLNPVVAGIVHEKEMEEYPWSSLVWFLDSRRSSWVKVSEVMGFFRGSREYREFLEDQVGYSREMGKIGYLLLDE